MKTPPPFSNEVILFMNYYNNIQKDQTKQKKKKKQVGNSFYSTVKWFTLILCVGYYSLLQYLLFLVEVCEYRKTSFASELGTPHYDRLTGCDGNI